LVRFSSGAIARRGDVRRGGVASRPAWFSRGRFLRFGGTLMSKLYSTSVSTNSDGFDEVIAYDRGTIEVLVGSAVL